MRFWHSGVLTVDIEATVDFICAASGMTQDKWNVMEVEFPKSKMLAGEGGELRVAIGRVAGMPVELLQPLDDLSYHAKILRERGPGFHHNAYIIEEGQEEAIAALVAAGGKIVWEMLSGEEHVYYVEAADRSAVLEIINCCPFMPEE